MTKKGLALFKSVEQEREWSEPASLVEYFDRDVIGQKRAKEMVAGSVALHIHRMRTRNTDLRKGNVLLIGNSGTGKTHLVRTLAGLLQERAPAIKYAETSVPGKSSAGYVNENFASFLEGLRDPKEEAPYGIIFVDEIDKTVNTDDAAKGFFEERIQRELIGMLEDALYRGDESKKVASLRTRNLLFIAAGAFQGLEGVIKRRIGGKT